MKPRILHFVCGLLAVLALPGSAAVEPAPVAAAAPGGPKAAPLTLVECIRRALERGYTMAIQGYGPGIAADSLVAARSTFKPTLSASASQSGNRTEDGTRSNGMNTSFSVSERLPTGATVTFGTNLNRSAINPAFSSLNPAYASDLSVSLQQPLLQGAGSAINLAPIRRAEVGVDNAQRSYESSALDTVLATEDAYYQLAGTREHLAVVKASLGLSERLLLEARTKAATGVATRLDVLQAEVGLASSRQGVLQAENAVKAAEDALLALIGRFEFDQLLGPVQLVDAGAVSVPSVEASFALAKKNQPDFRTAQASLELAELDVAAAKDGLKPALALDLAVGFNGNGASSNSALGGSLARDNSSWQAGLSVSYPWGRSAEKARLRQARAGLEQQRLSVEQLEQSILQRVRGAVRDIATNLEAVKIAALATQSSLQQYEVESARFKSGLTTSRLVLFAQNDLENARVSELQARLNLQGSLANLRRIEGSTLQYYGLTLPAAAPDERS